VFAQWADEVWRKGVSFIDIATDVADESFFLLWGWGWLDVILVVGVSD
jgi:hypothetical protein